MRNMYVIDVSGHQGEIDFEKVKAAGIQGVMLKCTEGTSYISPAFKRNYEKATAAGLLVGAYHFLRAHGETGFCTNEACEEGRNFGQAIEGLHLPLGVALDIEPEGCHWEADRDGDPISERAAYNAINGFAQNVAKYGRPEVWEEKEMMIYSTISYFNTLLTDPDVRKYPRWLANPDKLSYPLPVKMVQYSWTGRVMGVDTDVDINMMLERPAAVNMASFEEEPTRFMEPADYEPDPILPEAEKPAPAPADAVRIVGKIGDQDVDLTILK